MNRMDQNIPNKRLAFSLGGKGGVGKTLAMITLSDMLTDSEVIHSAFDCDRENAGKASSLAHFLPGISGPDIRSKADVDRLLNETLQGEADITLVDLPANAGGDFLPWFAQAKEGLDFLPIKLICVGVITPEPASAASVFEWARKLQDKVAYIVVLNRRKEERVEVPIEESFSEYYGATGQEFRQRANPIEVIMPGLYDGSMVQLMRHPILPSQLRQGEKNPIPVLDRARIIHWGRQTRAEWQKAKSLLGIES
jgi:hypothetical protein